MRSFASDNNSGIHPLVLKAIEHANKNHAVAYGDDAWTVEATQKIKALFTKETEVFFTFNGTGANVLGLQTMLKPYEAILCSEHAHIHVDECGAPEKHAGVKLLPVITVNGKLTIPEVTKQYQGVGNPHHVQPRVISISQSTELGTVYTPTEIRALAEFAHARSMFLHVDGARIANAIASVGCTPKEMIVDTGVDVLSFGGTKNGIMIGEAVVVINPKLGRDLHFLRKQGMQLSSKMRFISAQFDALLTDDLWLKNARHSNEMARLLEKEVREIRGIEITRPVDANALFVKIPLQAAEALRKKYFFYTWNEATSEVRWMASFDTTQEDIKGFSDAIRASMRSGI